VQRDGGGPLVLGPSAGFEVGQVVVVDALAHLHRHGHVAGGPDRRADQVAEQHRVGRQGGSPAAAGDLGRRAADVEVDVVDALGVHELTDRRAHHVGVGRVQLDAADRLVGAERRPPVRGLVDLQQGAGAHHLADVETRAVGTADRAVRRVGDAGHRREHDRDLDLERTDPQAGGRDDGHAELAEQVAQQRQRQPDDVARVAVDAVDEGRRATVEGEGPGDVQRLAGRDVRHDFGVGGPTEAHDGGRGTAGRPAGAGVDDDVTGQQGAAAPAHAVPAGDGVGGVDGLAQCVAVELEQRVAADDQAVRFAGGDGLGLAPGQLQDQGGRTVGLHPGLVDAADDHDRVQTGVAQQPQPGRRRTGQHEPADGDAHVRQRYRRPLPGDPPQDPRRRRTRPALWAAKLRWILRVGGQVRLL